METQPIYDVYYFIRKFNAIPEERWGCTSVQNNCVLHYLGVEWYSKHEVTDEVKALAKLFGCESQNESDIFESIWHVNDAEWKRPGTTPKQRVLAELYDIKAKQLARETGRPIIRETGTEPQQPKEKVVYRTVLIDKDVRDLQTKELTMN